MKAHEFDTAFDAGGDVSHALDWSKARRPNEALRRVTVDLPNKCRRVSSNQQRIRER